METLIAFHANHHLLSTTNTASCCSSLSTSSSTSSSASASPPSSLLLNTKAANSISFSDEETTNEQSNTSNTNSDEESAAPVPVVVVSAATAHSDGLANIVKLSDDESSFSKMTSHKEATIYNSWTKSLSNSINFLRKRSIFKSDSSIVKLNTSVNSAAYGSECLLKTNLIANNNNNNNSSKLNQEIVAKSVIPKKALIHIF